MTLAIIQITNIPARPNKRLTRATIGENVYIEKYALRFLSRKNNTAPEIRKQYLIICE